MNIKCKLQICFIALFILLFSPFSSPAKYHPEIKWKEISAKPFIVVFPDGYEEIADYTLNWAQCLYKDQLEFWGGDIRLQGPIRILLTDVYDIANGSATFFPYNRIELFLFNPPPDSSLGGYDEWVKLVLSHELTHIIHFNWGSGFSYFWRTIFGTNPLLYPTVVIPPWLIEGTAVFDESRVNRWGRLDTPDYSLLLNQLTAAGKIRDWRRIWGDSTAWPGGTTPYLYGAAFCKFLEQRYGKDKLPLLLRHYARHPVPVIFPKKKGPVILSFQYRIKEVFGKDIDELWAEFNVYLKNLAKESTENKSAAGAVRFLTRTGKSKLYPVVLNARRIAYVNSNYKEYPGIYMLDIADGTSRRLTQTYNVTSMHYSKRDKRIYYSATEYNRAYYRYSDIYSIDPFSGKKKRLSHGKRLFYPVTAPIVTNGDNRTDNFESNNNTYIYCIKRIKMKSYLCRFYPQNGTEELISGGYDSLAFPSVSPDERQIAVSLKEHGQNWRIALFKLPHNDSPMKMSSPALLTNGNVKSFYPRWYNREHLFYISEHSGEYRLAEMNTNEQAIYIKVYSTPGLPSLKSFDFLPGQEGHIQLTGSFYDKNGFNIGVLDTTGIKTEKIPHSSSTVKTNSDTPASLAETNSRTGHSSMAKRYNRLRELLPKYIIPGYRKGGNEYQPGISIGGSDLTGTHSYGLDGYYGFNSDKAGVRLKYTYDGLFPTLSFTYSDLSGSYSTSHSLQYIHNRKIFEFSMLYPLSFHQRSQLYLFSDIHFETVSDFIPTTKEHFGYRVNGMKLALFFNSAVRYYDSISDADGMQFSLSYSREFKFLGSDYRIEAAALDYKYYLALGRPNVLALRLAAIESWGEARRLIYMGGSDSQTGFQVVGNDLFNLMRAYPAGYFTGTGGFIVNAEYRISLFKPESVFFVFRSVERVYLSLFADAGNVWQDNIKIHPSFSLGTEFNVLTYLGEFKLNIAAGMAVGLRPNHKPLFYLRLGRAF